MRRSLATTAIVLWAATALAAPDSMRLTVTGIPQGHGPVVVDAIAGKLAADPQDPIAVTVPSSEWFWQCRPAEYTAEVVFERYYAGREQRTLIPMLAARYAYEMNTSGYVVVTAFGDDTVRTVVPFEFTWQRPVHYQWAGVQPQAASVQITAPESVKLEYDAMEALGLDLARAIRHGVKRAGSSDAAP